MDSKFKSSPIQLSYQSLLFFLSQKRNINSTSYHNQDSRNLGLYNDIHLPSYLHMHRFWDLELSRHVNLFHKTKPEYTNSYNFVKLTN